VIGLKVTLKANRFGALSAAERAAVRRVRHTTGLAIERDWKAGVRVATGTLRRSIRTEDGEIRTEVVSDVEYALYQEYGTTTMAANPAATRAAEKHRRRYAQQAQAAIRNAR
jgi:hypothetical protein